MSLEILKEFMKKQLLDIPKDLNDIYEYFILSADLLFLSQEIDKTTNYDNNISKLIEMQLKELELRQRIISSETKEKISFAIDKIESEEIKKLLTTVSKLDKINPNFTLNVFIDFSKSLGNEYVNLSLKNMKMLSDVDFIKIKDVPIVYKETDSIQDKINRINLKDNLTKESILKKRDNLLSGYNTLKNLPEEYRIKYINAILEQEYYTNEKTEKALASYSKKYTGEDAKLGISENKKAWIAFFSKTLVESQSKLSIQEYMKEFKEEHGIANAAIDELANLKPKDFSELASGISNLDIFVLPNELNNIINGMIIKHIDKLTNIVDTLNTLSPTEVIKTIEDLIDGVNGLIDGSTSGAYSIAKFSFKLIPESIKMKFDIYVKLIDFKNNKVEQISNLIKEKLLPVEELQKILVEYLGVIGDTQKNIGKNITNQKAKNIVNILERIGEQEIESRKTFIEGKKDIKSTLENKEFFEDKKTQEYLIDLFLKKTVPDLNELNIIFTKAFGKIEDNFAKYEHFIEMAKLSNNVQFNKTVEDRFEREIFINYLLNQTDLNSLPDKKRNIYLDSLIGRNDVDSKTIYSKSPSEDYNLKLTFLNQTLKDIEDRKTNKLYSKDKIEIMEEAISLLKNIINIERHNRYGTFDIIKDKNDREKFIGDNFLNISEIKHTNNPIIKTLLMENKQQLEILNNNKEIDDSKFKLKEKLIDKIILEEKGRVKEWNNFDIIKYKQSNMPTELKKDFFDNVKISEKIKHKNSIFGDSSFGNDSDYLTHKSAINGDFLKNIKNMSQKDYNLFLINLEPNESNLKKLLLISESHSLINKNNKFLMNTQNNIHDVILMSLNKSKNINSIASYENSANVIEAYFENKKIKTFEEIDKNILYLIFASKYDLSNIGIENKYKSNEIFGLSFLEDCFSENDKNAFKIIQEKMYNIEDMDKNRIMNSLTENDLEIISKSSILKMYFVEFFSNEPILKNTQTTLEENELIKFNKMMDSLNDPKITFLTEVEIERITGV